MTERDELIGRILEIQRQFRRQMTAERTHSLLDIHLTMSQLKVMIILGQPGVTSGQELARRTGFSLATLTGVVDRLIGQGLVSRGENPLDRRVRHIELTQAGTDLVDRLIAAGEDHQQRLLRHLDDAALGIVAQAYGLLLQAIIADQDQPADVE